MILQDLCGIGLRKTLPSHGSEERWRSLSPDSYREMGGENLQVLLILRRKVGKCRSHTMCFGVMERCTLKSIGEKNRGELQSFERGTAKSPP